MNAPSPSPATLGTADDVATRVASTIRADVRARSAYVVAKADGLIKLDAMENPYALPDDLRARVASAAAAAPLNRYPDGGADVVKAALRRSLGLDAGVALLLGNGSDELIQIITTAIARPGTVIVAPDPTFVMYRVNAELAHARYVPVPLRADFALDVEALLDTIAREQPALVWLAYPNNPTGNRFERAGVEQVLGAAPGLVVVDEAYYAFAGDSFLPRALAHPNLVVVRTVSKIGMAGLRLGYAAGHPAWIGELEKVRPPYNVGTLVQAVAPVVLDAAEVLAGQAAAIVRERTRVAAALRGVHGFTVFPTETNFVLVRVPDAGASFAALRAAGILVKNLHGWHPLLAQCLRITIGTPAENDAVLRVLAAS
ncbi:MAG TPA: histidinol-phosphate transaminase [Casimicrobiaceae bacterium]|nr:histidinol-phosphate transaminase [Casimicrobiaceae bacterium]